MTARSDALLLSAATQLEKMRNLATGANTIRSMAGVLTLWTSVAITFLEVVPLTVPFLRWWTADRLMAAANIILVLVAIITAAIGLRAILQTKEIIRQNEVLRSDNSAAALASQRQQEEYNRLASSSAESQSRSVELQRQAVERAHRPMMTARYLRPETPTSDLTLEISNVGNSVAYDVQVRFDPPLPQPDLEALNANSSAGKTYLYPSVSFADTVFADRTFKTWVPGQSVTTPFWVYHIEHEVGDRFAPSAEGIPVHQQVHVTYRNEAFEHYADAFDLDPGIWAGVTFPETDASLQRKAIEKLSKTSEKHGEAIISKLNSILAKDSYPFK